MHQHGGGETKGMVFGASNDAFHAIDLSFMTVSTLFVYWRACMYARGRYRKGNGQGQWIRLPDGCVW